MPKYKGGEILVDLSDIVLDSNFHDYLPSDLKSYLSQLVINDIFSSEILMKPIEIIIQVTDFDGENHTIRVKFSLLNSDKDLLISDPLIVSNYMVRLLMITDLTIASTWEELTYN